jgi:hypothetical protein
MRIRERREGTCEKKGENEQAVWPRRRSEEQLPMQSAAVCR